MPLFYFIVCNSFENLLRIYDGFFNEILMKMRILSDIFSFEIILFPQNKSVILVTFFKFPGYNENLRVLEIEWKQTSLKSTVTFADVQAVCISIYGR